MIKNPGVFYYRGNEIFVMVVFRINKTQDYTVMSNFRLKDRSLSLNPKGLLPLILSLPEDWIYTTRGLAAVCKEDVDSIGTALKELERAGYIKRNRLCFEKSQDNPDMAKQDATQPYTKTRMWICQIRKCRVKKTPHN